MPVKLRGSLRLEATETETDIGVGDGTSQLIHRILEVLELDSGTGASQVDAVLSSRVGVTDSGVTVDCAGGTSVLTGDTVTMAEVVAVVVVNRSSVSGETLTVGAGSNPLGIFSDSSDSIVIGPGGIVFWLDAIDGVSVTGGASDILSVTASSGDTISTDILVLGRTA